MEKQSKTLMERFANIKLLEKKAYEFRCYFLEKRADGLLANIKLGITCPDPFNSKVSYKAEVKISLSPKGGIILHQHHFTFEPAALEAELRKIDVKWAETIILPDRMANALNDCYHEIAPYLIDYNETGNDYTGMAEILYKYRGSSIAPKFGL